MSRFDDFDRDAARMQRRALGVFIVAVVLKLALLAALGLGAVWTYQHVIVPSFGAPRLQVTP